MIMHPAMRFKNWLSAAIPCAKRFLLARERSVLHSFSCNTDIKCKWFFDYQNSKCKCLTSLCCSPHSVIDRHSPSHTKEAQVLIFFSSRISHSTSLIVLEICPSLLDGVVGHLLLGPDSLLKIRTHPAWSRLFYLFLHLEVSSWTWVGQTDVTFLMSYDRFRAHKFALNVCTVLWHIFYLSLFKILLSERV